MTPEKTAPFSIRMVAIIGAGAKGREFALACAVAGFSVVLEDVMPANLRLAQARFADLSSEMGIDGHLSVALTVEDAVRESDVAVDFVPDELESKLEIFCLVDRMAPPKTILLTPSDALSITDLASCTYRGDRCFAVRGGLNAGSGGARMVHPPGAADDALAAVADFLRRLSGSVAVETDTAMPMLMKNLNRAAR